MNLASILLCHAAARPRHPAIVNESETLGHAEIATLAGRYAARLADAGVGVGARVGLCLPDTPDHLVLHYAVAWLGATIVPIDHRWTLPEKLAITKAFDCRVVVTDAVIPSFAAKTLALDPSWRSVDIGAPPMADDGDLPVMLSLSSGTTGRPSGSLVSHRELYERWIAQWVGIGFNARDRFMLATPLYFGAGRSFGMSFLAAGATVVFCPPPANAEKLIEIAQREKVSALFLVPTQIRGLLDAWRDRGLALPGVRLLVTSGSAIASHERAQIMERLTPGFVDYYGTSEGGGISLLMPEEQLAYAETVGRPSFRVEVEIVDEAGKAMPLGEIGRLRYRGPGVSRLMVSAAGEQTLSADGWLEPGDLARILPTGHVKIAGRAKDVIIRGGANIYPAEVESVIREISTVAEVCVFGAADARLGETVVAAIVMRPGQSFDEAATRVFLRERLAPYKIPDRFMLVDDLPRNTSGKVIRAKLADL